jgi:WD40 repeat protein
MPRLDTIRVVFASLALLGLSQALHSNPLPESVKGEQGDSLPRGARARLNASLGPLSAVAFSPNGDCVAAGSDGGSVCLWNWQHKTEPRVFTGHKDRVWSVAFSPDGLLLASAGNEGQIILWDTATGQQVHRLDNHGSAVYAIAFSADGLTLASGSRDDYVRLWRAATGKELCRFGGPLPQELARPQVEAPRKGVTSLAFSPDGRYLAAASGDQAIHLWDVAAGREQRRFEGHSGVVVALGFSADGRTLASSATTAFFTRNGLANSASGLLDGTVRLWEVASGQERCRFHSQQHSGNPMAFAPDGRLVAALDPFDRTIRLWDTSTEELFDQYEGHRPMNRGPAAAVIEALAISPTGRLLASAAGDGSILLWRANMRPQPAPVPNRQSCRLVDVLWWELSGEDAALAYRAHWRMLQRPQETVRFLRQHLRPAPTNAREPVARLVARLDHDRFPIRERATHELEQRGAWAEPALRRALQGTLSAEARSRMERVLSQLDQRGPDSASLREIRAVEVLEHLGSQDSRALLETLAQGDPDARLTIEVKESLARLSKP